MRCFGLSLLGALCAMLSAQPALTFPPPEVFAPDEGQLTAITEKTEALRDGIKAGKVTDPDVLIFLKAAEYMLLHGEWYKGQAKMTLDVLDDGLKRARAWGGLVGGFKEEYKRRYPWKRGAVNVGAYRSKIDGSIQPFAVTIPAGEKKGGWPLHVVLHGRNGALTEVSFLHRAMKGKAAKGLDHVVLDIYGRGNNAYRWAGETDIWEALEECRRRSWDGDGLDVTRTVLRGFSMGGAGTWHLGLHHPDRFAVIGPGAGFTTTHGYIAKLPKKLAPHQEACLSIYDAVRYAENAALVPVVAYSGEDDPQKAAADNIEKALAGLPMKITHIVAPKTKHTIPPDYQKKLLAEYAKQATPRHMPEKIRFVTHTLKYPGSHWLRITHLEKHYDRAVIEADLKGGDKPSLRIKTTNVAGLHFAKLSFDEGAVKVEVDGQTVEGIKGTDIGLAASLTKQDGKWRQRTGAELNFVRDEKTHGMTGPIDDAFTKPFVCIRGTGKPWNAAVQAHAVTSLERFKQEWSKYMRGDIRIVDDKDQFLSSNHEAGMILFGDPGSNQVIKELLPHLPFKWTQKTITWRGKEYDAAIHVPVMIRPNPEARTHTYIVLNSGHTFHKADFEGTNALLYPRLGDWALLKVKDAKKPLEVEVVTAGLFDERWKFPK